MRDVDRTVAFGERPGGFPERIAPGFFDERTEADHVARYAWAARRTKSGRVLDLACGTGYGAGVLRKQSEAQVFSADISLDAATFGKNAYDINVAVTDGQRVAFKDASFDVVVSMETV